MLEFAVNLNKPVVIRYPRGGEDEYKIEKQEKIEEGKAEILKEGKDLTIIAIGKTVARAIKIAEKIEKENENKNTFLDKEEDEKEKEYEDTTVEVINARFLKPIDEEIIKKSIEKTKNVITIEDGTIINGLGTAVQEIILNNKIEGVKIKSYAYPDKYIEHGSVEELEKIYGLDEEKIQNETRGTGLECFI